jgi:hypothetical protein
MIKMSPDRKSHHVVRRSRIAGVPDVPAAWSPEAEL